MAKKKVAKRQLQTWLIMSDLDPNDSFYVSAYDQDQAVWQGLQQLGWSVSAEPIDDDTDVTGYPDD